MIRPILFTLMLSTGLLALPGHAYAQSAPDTRQTDQSEEDWRKSQKKTGDTDDILDIIKNTRGSGVGNGRGFSPVDALPEESRRHLIKERAKRLAQAGPNEPADLTYKPSEAAKTDSNLQSDEKEAWEQLAQKVRNEQFANGQAGGGQGNQQGQSTQQGQAGQQGQSAQQGQAGQQGQSPDGTGPQSRSRSVLRGGSSASVADIMAQLKGLGQAPTGQPGGQASGQNQAGTAQAGQGNSSGAASAPQSDGAASQGSADGQGSANGQGNADGQNNADGQSKADGQDNANGQNSAAGAEGQGQDSAAGGASNAAQDAAQTRPPVSPLDRLKNARQNDDGRGARSSASDFLKKKD